MKLLSRLFSAPRNSSQDGLSQTQREAIIDLLLICIYADNHLSVAEDKVLKDQVESCSWDSGTSAEIYIAIATSKARRAKSDESLQSEYLQYIADRLESPASKAKALSLVDELFESDGIAESETSFTAKIQSLLS